MRWIVDGWMCCGGGGGGVDDVDRCYSMLGIHLRVGTSRYLKREFNC